MKTNLIFKRIINTNEGSTTQLKVVTVDIPGINKDENWVLSGQATDIDFSLMERSGTSNVETKDVVKENVKPTQLLFGSKFESNVVGTAKLVRVRDKIWIAHRKGKATYNETSINSVCIDESIKNQFFEHCKEYRGNNTDIFEFSKIKDPNPYQYWSRFMNEEYSRQLEYLNKSLINA